VGQVKQDKTGYFC